MDVEIRLFRNMFGKLSYASHSSHCVCIITHYTAFVSLGYLIAIVIGSLTNKNGFYKFQVKWLYFISVNSVITFKLFSL